MTGEAFKQPTARTYSIEDLVGHVRAGRVRIPDFQRPLRWQRRDVQRLFESIILGYPIGSLLLWERPAVESKLQLGALTIQAPAFDSALWVVDGQQRLTSLASALSEEGLADPRFALSYDPEKNAFGRPSDTATHHIPLPTLFDLSRLLKWFSEHPASEMYMERAFAATKAIREYRVPAYIVEQDDEKVLQDIFDRMNTYGKPLSRAEVFSALHLGGESLNNATSFPDVSSYLDAKFGFGPIDENTILRVVLARRGADITREIRNEFEGDASRDFPNETADKATQGAKKALERTVQFLQEEAGVPHFGFLAYRYLLVVLARFFAHHPRPTQRNRDLLRRWFWRAAMLGPAIARGAYTSAMRSLAKCIVPGDETGSVMALLKAVSSLKFAYELPPFKSTAAETRFMLCALWSLNPHSVESAKPYEREQLSVALEGRRTASRALTQLVPRVAHAAVHAGNRAFLIGGDTHEDLCSFIASGSDGPSDAFLESHALSSGMVATMLDGRSEDFFRARDLEVVRVTIRFLERMTEMSFEDTPPLRDLVMDEDDGDWPDDDAPA